MVYEKIHFALFIDLLSNVVMLNIILISNTSILLSPSSTYFEVNRKCVLILNPQRGTDRLAIREGCELCKQKLEKV